MPSADRVALAVLLLCFEDLAHVFAGLGIGNRFDRQRASLRPFARHPVVDVADTAVIGREGQHLVAAVVVEQIAQVVAAVRDVDRRRREITGLERVPPGEVREVFGGARQQLHQPLRTGARGSRFEVRLGVDDGCDQRRVEVLFAGLRTNDPGVREG